MPTKLLSLFSALKEKDLPDEVFAYFTGVIDALLVLDDCSKESPPITLDSALTDAVVARLKDMGIDIVILPISMN